jgi:hypothetical protein
VVRKRVQDGSKNISKGLERADENSSMQMVKKLFSVAGNFGNLWYSQTKTGLTQKMAKY